MHPVWMRAFVARQSVRFFGFLLLGCLAASIHLLPAAALAAESTPEAASKLSATPTPQPDAEITQTTISLSLGGRMIDANGLLMVDANMPDRNGQSSTADTFAIPYLQSERNLSVAATVQNAPAGAGVEFVLDPGSTQLDTSTPFEATFSLPAFGDYRLSAYLVDASGVQLGPTLTIDPLSYGRVFVAIGDSITAGFQGDEVTTSDKRYPVTSYQRSPSFSRDRRNIFQYNNSQASGRPFFRGYQLDLNDRLTECGGAPVFILNDGFNSLRTGRDSSGKVNALSKLTAYRSHIDLLGAQGVLLGIGTNDIQAGLSPTAWAADLNLLIDGLQAEHPGLEIWVARLPWRGDGLADKTAAYNVLIPGIVEAQNEPGYPVRLGPDLYTYFKDNPLQLGDGVHPTQSGYNAMAGLWSASVCTRIRGTAQRLPLAVR